MPDTKHDAVDALLKAAGITSGSDPKLEVLSQAVQIGIEAQSFQALSETRDLAEIQTPLNMVICTEGTAYAGQK